jgi:hypothetical protein
MDRIKAFNKTHGQKDGLSQLHSLNHIDINTIVEARTTTKYYLQKYHSICIESQEMSTTIPALFCRNKTSNT